MAAASTPSAITTFYFARTSGGFDQERLNIGFVHPDNAAGQAITSSFRTRKPFTYRAQGEVHQMNLAKCAAVSSSKTASASDSCLPGLEGGFLIKFNNGPFELDDRPGLFIRVSYTALTALRKRISDDMGSGVAVTCITNDSLDTVFFNPQEVRTVISGKAAEGPSPLPVPRYSLSGFITAPHAVLDSLRRHIWGSAAAAVKGAAGKKEGVTLSLPADASSSAAAITTFFFLRVSGDCFAEELHNEFARPGSDMSRAIEESFHTGKSYEYRLTDDLVMQMNLAKCVAVFSTTIRSSSPPQAGPRFFIRFAGDCPELSVRANLASHDSMRQQVVNDLVFGASVTCISNSTDETAFIRAAEVKSTRSGEV